MTAANNVVVNQRMQFPVDTKDHGHRLSIQLTSLAAAATPDMQRREDALQRLRSAMAPLGAAVTLFGSCATGLALPTSDVDVMITAQTPRYAGNLPWLEHIAQTLIDSGTIAQNKPTITNAQVPILRFVEAESQLKVDIVGGVPVAATGEWILEQQRLHPSFRPVVLALKVFLAQRCLHETYKGFIGSYLLYVMVAEAARSTMVAEAARSTSAGESSLPSFTAADMPLPSGATSCGPERLLLEFLKRFSGSDALARIEALRCPVTGGPLGEKAFQSSTVTAEFGRALWLLRNAPHGMSLSHLLLGWSEDRLVCSRDELESLLASAAHVHESPASKAEAEAEAVALDPQGGRTRRPHVDGMHARSAQSNSKSQSSPTKAQSSQVLSVGTDDVHVGGTVADMVQKPQELYQEWADAESGGGDAAGPPPFNPPFSTRHLPPAAPAAIHSPPASALRLDAQTFVPQEWWASIPAHQPDAGTEADSGGGADGGGADLGGGADGGGAKMTRRRWRASNRRMVNELTEMVRDVVEDDEEEDVALGSGVRQMYSVTTVGRQLPALHALLRHLLSGLLTVVAAPRVVVFCQTVGLTQFYADCFSKLGWAAHTLHSSKCKAVQERVREAFFRDGGVMFASDVMVGRDMEAATCETVVQLGLPSSARQYRRRLGHCAVGGTGHLLICDFEVACCVRELQLVMAHDRGLVCQLLGKDPLPLLGKDLLAPLKGRAHEQYSFVQAYRSWLGYYNSHLKRLNWSREELVRHAAKFAVEGLGLASVPALEKRDVGMMALKGVAGLVVTDTKVSPSLKRGGGSSGAYGRGGRGGSGHGGGGRGGGAYGGAPLQKALNARGEAEGTLA